MSSVVAGVFGKLKSGEEASLFKLSNANGIEVDITSYGAVCDPIL